MAEKDVVRSYDDDEWVGQGYDFSFSPYLLSWLMARKSMFL